MKLFGILFIFLSMNIGFVMPVDLLCSYEFDSWKVVGRTYHCDVQNYLNIFSSGSADITGATGSHDGGENNDDVHGFYAYNKKIEIFPRGLEKIYKNLKAISIRNGRIKEIHQSDLKPFSQLGYLNLDRNDIEVLEEGLFDFNPKLGFISFSYNKISQIHSNIFDHLTKLTYLRLYGNQCISKDVDDNSAEVKELIKEVKLQCPSPLIASRQVQKPETNLNDLNLQFTEKLTKIEKTFQNSIEDLSQKFTKLEESTKASQRKLEDSVLECSQKVQNLNESIAKSQSSISTRIDQIEKSLKSSEAETTKHFESLEKALKSSDENFNNFQSKVMTSFTQILDKIDEKLKNFEDKAMERIQKIDADIKSSQIEAFKLVVDKVKNFEENIKQLQEAVEYNNKALYLTCDP